MKKVLIAVLLVAAAVATLPYWGGCELNARRCSTWCTIKHMNNDLQAAGCRARCAMENAACQGEEAAQGVDDVMKGLQGR
ncbi:MAG TPA: hypothetical protein VGE00_01700 [Gammaproteobacteria bacterium]